MAWVSLNSLLSSQALSSGELWLVLATINHPSFASPARFASPRYEPIVSLTRTFQPARFDVVYPSEQTDEAARASVSFDGVSGVILAALQGLRPRPTITLELVLDSDPDTIVFTAPDFEISNLLQDGVTSTVLELEASRTLTLPFPGINMDRRRMAGMFTDIG